jgi:WD40 repeat protein
MLGSALGERPPAVLRGKTAAFTSVAFSPNGQRLATVTTAPELILWDVTTTQPLAIQYPGMTGAIAAVAFSPDGRLLAAAGGEGTVWVWDASRGTALTELLASFWITSLAFSPEGQFLAAGGGTPGKPGEIRVWKMASGQTACDCQGHTDLIQCLAFSPQGNRLISGSTDQTIKVWELIGGQETMALREHSGPVRDLAFSSDGQRLFSAGRDGTIKIWEAPAVVAEEHPRR